MHLLQPYIFCNFSIYKEYDLSTLPNLSKSNGKGVFLACFKIEWMEIIYLACEEHFEEYFVVDLFFCCEECNVTLFD